MSEEEKNSKEVPAAAEETASAPEKSGEISEQATPKPKPKAKKKAAKKTPPQELKAEEKTPPQEPKAEEETPPQKPKAKEKTPPQEPKAEEKTPPQELKAEEETPPQKPKAEEKTPSQEPESSEKEKASKQEEGETEKAEEKPKAPSAKDLLKTDIGDLKIRRAKGSKNISSGIVHILATFNNTKVTFSDKNGNVLSWSSAGKCGFRGSRKSTAFAAQVVTQDAGRTAMGHGLREIEVRVKGPGMGRDSAVRALQSLGLIVSSLTDVTPVPHNGCRPPKRRRV